MGIITISFILLFIMAIASAVMMILSKNPVNSILWLIVLFFAISGHYILLNAQFLAIVNIIVYAGAIMVLFLFALMFINMNKDTEKHKSIMLKSAATISSGLLLIVLVAVTKGSEYLQSPAERYTDVGTVKNLGNALYGQYLLPFEITSILLLAAMVGAVMLGKKQIS